MTSTNNEGPALPPLAPTAKRLFLVRHGEVINPGGDRPVYYGALDVPLSHLGRLEATAAARYLAQYSLAHVFCSPLSRAVYGAEQIAQLQQQQQQKSGTAQAVIQLEGFTELDRGDWCGKTKAEIGEAAMAAFDACDESVTPANGESFPTLKRRVLAARDECLRRLAPGQSACVVSHLQVTRSLLSEALGVPTEQMTTLPVATASVTCIDYDEEDDDSNNEEKKITVHFQSFKPEAGLAKAVDGAN